MKPPSPGIYRNVPEADYRKWDAMNFSSLKHGARSMAHLRHAIQTEGEGSDAMALGTAVDVLVLDPANYPNRIAVAPDVDRRTKAGKRTWEAFCADSAGKTIITAEQSVAATAMRAAIEAHPTASKLIRAEGHTQCCAVWVDTETGVTCKGRLDKFIPGKLVFDLKTCADASPWSFARSVARYRYHQQMSWYADGFRRATKGYELPIEEPLFVCVENEPPYAVAVYRLDEAAIQFGADQNRMLLRKFVAARDANKWPGYPEEVQTLRLPAWAMEPTGGDE